MTRHEERERERELVTLAQSLPREIAPPPEAWSGIAARLTGDRLSLATAPVQFWQRPAVLAAAALLLVVLTSTVTVLVVQPDERTNAASRAAATGTAPGTALAEFAARENDYLQLVNTLEAVVEDESTGLSPETIAIIRANLLVIDAAILDARRALAEDPANRSLVDILASTYEKKLDLLRRTTAMARSS